MQENRQHTHQKKLTQDIPYETLIEGKNQASKSINHNVLLAKTPL